MSRRITSTRVALAAVSLFALTMLFSHSPHAGSRNRTNPTLQAPGGFLIINEVDSDQASTDTTEFIELYDGGIGNTPLDGYVVVFFNGGAANDASYAAFDLDGFTTNPAGYFTVGNAAVPGVDLVFANGALQNGPDAVALFSASASDFPNGTPVTTTNIVDALVYSNTATIDAGLLVLLNVGQAQINENSAGTGTTVSMQRIPNGTGGERNTSSYSVHAPTPDGPNLGPTVSSVSLSGRVMDASGNGIAGSRLLLEGGGMSEPRLAITSSFGYYRFEDLATGMYMITVGSKRYTFAVPTRVVSISDNVSDFDFVAEAVE